MSSLEQPFVDSIAANQIEGVILQGRSIEGGRYSKTLGKRTLPDGTQKELLTEDIVFLASATKLLTTIAALQCCEKNLLSLDADLAPVFPEMVKHGVLTGDKESSDNPSTGPLRKPLTLRHLLTHSSGLIYEFASEPMQRWRSANPLSADIPDVPTRLSTALDFQPGESWTYGISLDWTGYIVEKMASMRLDEYFRKFLLEPLGLAESELSFFPVREGMGERMPELNPKDPGGNGLSAAMGNNVHGESMTGCFGGQGGYGSSEAYITILESLLLNDGKLLKKDTVEEMFKPQLGPASMEAWTGYLNGPWGPFMANNTFSTHRTFGLGGLLASEEPNAGFGSSSLTWGGGCNTAWFIDSENGICGFANLQLGLPPDVEKARELKGVFRSQLQAQLKAKS